MITYTSFLPVLSCTEKKWDFFPQNVSLSLKSKIDFFSKWANGTVSEKCQILKKKTI